MVESSFEKKFRLLSASDFNQLKVGSLSFKKASLIVYYKKNSFNQTRIGISVSKKIGNAVIRNRLKRLIRENFRLSSSKFLGYDMLIVVSWSRRIMDESFEAKEGILVKNLNELFNFLSSSTNDNK